MCRRVVFSRVDSARTRVHSLRVKKMRVILDRYLDALEVQGYGDIGRTCRELVCGLVMNPGVGAAQTRWVGWPPLAPKFLV